MNKEKKYNLVFVVAHPDDESLWIGGSLYFLNKFDFVNIHVICITGDKDKERKNSFNEAMDICGINNKIVLDHEIPTKGGIPLQRVEDYFLQGLAKMNLPINDVDLLVSHSPYGDEHNHVQHMQLFYEILKKAIDHKIPFGFFSFFPIPYFKLTPLLLNAKRDFGTHFLNLSLCEKSNNMKINFPFPQYFVQLQINSDIKKRMLKCYTTINQEEHQRGYFAWDSGVESFYLLQEKGTEVFKKIYEEMTSPTLKSCFV